MSKLRHSAGKGVYRVMRQASQDTLRLTIRLDGTHAEFRVRLIGPGLPFAIKSPPSCCFILTDDVPDFNGTNSIATDKRKSWEEV